LSVSDGINTSEHTTVTINVNNLNDNQPSDILLSNDQFSESEAIGTSIGTLSTLDRDKEGFHTYSLVTGAGDADNQKFDIDGDQLVTAVSYDYDHEKSFTIRVKMTDYRGDSYEKVFTITTEADRDIQLEIPTAFSPNGDQVNDTWEIDRLLSYPKHLLKVFNTDGMEVFSNAGYTAQWDGTHKGQEQAFGTYYYIIRLNDASGKVFKGTVLIIK
ncbi:MAG: gliding motility-associated C-terminal domain-containing protein, partial [Cyclobacteriaceae bacterium]